MQTIVLPTEPTIPATQFRDYITMFYGPPGVGKTTFVNSMGQRVLFLSTDRGTRFLPAMRIECNSWEMFIAAQRTIELKGKSFYDIVCIDHVDDMSLMAEIAVCKRLGIESLTDAGFGKGFAAYRREILNFVQNLMRLGTGVCFVAHETIKTVKVRSIELQRTMPDLSKSAWKVIVPLADLIGYAGFRTVKRGNPPRLEELRVLETVPRESLYLKDRTRRVKPLQLGYEPLDGATFVKTFYGAENPIGESYHGTSQNSDNGDEGATGEDVNPSPSTDSRTASPGRRSTATASPAAPATPAGNGRRAGR